MICLSLILLLLSSTAAAATPEEELNALLTPEVKAKLEKGELIVFKKGSKDAQGGSRGSGRVLVIINRSREDVWAVLTNDEERPNYAPHLISVERYYEEGDQVGIKETIRLLFKSYRYHCMQTRDKEAGTIIWHLDKTKENSIRDTTGSWFIRPYGENKTVVMYTLSVDSGLFFPKFAEDMMFNHDLPDIVKSLKEYMESKTHGGSKAAK